MNLESRYETGETNFDGMMKQKSFRRMERSGWEEVTREERRRW